MIATTAKEVHEKMVHDLRDCDHKAKESDRYDRCVWAIELLEDAINTGDPYEIANAGFFAGYEYLMFIQDTQGTQEKVAKFRKWQDALAAGRPKPRKNRRKVNHEQFRADVQLEIDAGRTKTQAIKIVSEQGGITTRADWGIMRDFSK